MRVRGKQKNPQVKCEKTTIRQRTKHCWDSLVLLGHLSHCFLTQGRHLKNRLLEIFLGKNLEEYLYYIQWSLMLFPNIPDLQTYWDLVHTFKKLNSRTFIKLTKKANYKPTVCVCVCVYFFSYTASFQQIWLTE